MPPATSASHRRLGIWCKPFPINHGEPVREYGGCGFCKKHPQLGRQEHSGYRYPQYDTSRTNPWSPVQKSGRTTGRTTGTIQTVNATVSVDYGAGCGTAKFVGQFIVTPGGFSAPGDSGSLILTNNTAKKPVGLLFAGSSTITVANRIADVLGALHAKID